MQFPYIEYEDYQFKNVKTSSRYQIVKKDDQDTVIIESKLSRPMIANFKLFTSYERQSLLKNQLMILLNMVPIDLMNNLNARYSDKEINYENFYEIMGGLNRYNFRLKDPQIIKENC